MATTRSLARFRRFTKTAETSGVVLEDGEFGWDEEAEVLKVGDGSTAWASLAALVDLS